MRSLQGIPRKLRIESDAIFEGRLDALPHVEITLAETNECSPNVVVALGSTALKALLEDAHARLQDHFGKVTRKGGRTILATWHPSYALRAPDPETRERA